MDAVEASRQYQIALEHERRTYNELKDTLSAQQEIEDAGKEVRHSYSQLVDSLAVELVGRLDRRREQLMWGSSDAA